MKHPVSAMVFCLFALYFPHLEAQQLQLLQESTTEPGNRGELSLVLTSSQDSYPAFNAQLILPDSIERDNTLKVLPGADLPESFRIHIRQYEETLNIVSFSTTDTVGSSGGAVVELLKIQFQVKPADNFKELPQDVTFKIEGSGNEAVNPSALSNASGSLSVPVPETTTSAIIDKSGVKILLSNLFQRHDGSAKPVTVETIPDTVPIIIRYNGNATPPVASGTYLVTVEVLDNPLYSGAAEAELAIEIDEDEDGMDDDWESLHFGTKERCLPDEDEDLDGLNNLNEFIAGLDPIRSTSCLSVWFGELPRDNLSLFLEPVAPQREYSISGSNNLQDWTPLPGLNFHAQDTVTFTEVSKNLFTDYPYLRIEIKRQ